MSEKAPAADWRVFRDLQKVALERFCTRILDEAERLLRDKSRSHHDRYLDLYRLMRERDEELAAAFDDPRRARLLWQAARMHALELIEPDELARFSEKTRASIESTSEVVRESLDE